MEEDEPHPLSSNDPQPHHGNQCLTLVAPRPRKPPPPDNQQGNDDGIRRITWDEFLRWGNPPKKKKSKEERREERRKRKREQLDEDDGNNYDNDNDRNPSESKKGKVPWATRFQQLKDYKEKHNSIKVPQKYEEDQHFSNWVQHMRKKFVKRLQGNEEALSDAKFEALSSLGFEDPAVAEERPWKIRFRQLQDYKENYGDTKVPQKWDEDQSFAHWVKKQRRDYTLRLRGETKAMKDSRFEALQRLGFEPNNARVPTTSGEFDTRLAQMKSFKAEYRHTRVPKGYDAIPGLRQWVIKIRKKYREKKKGIDSGITQQQIDELDKIDFYWNANKGNKNATANNNGTTYAPETDSAMEVDNENISDAPEAATKSEIKMENKDDTNAAEAEAGVEANNRNVPNAPENDTEVNNRNETNTPEAEKDEGSDSADDYDYQPRPRLSEFDERLIQLRTFKSQFNHFRVPKDLHPALWKFVVKVRKQFRDKRKGKPSDITDDQIRRLNELGFVWKKPKTESSNNGTADNHHLAQPYANVERGSHDTDDSTPGASLNGESGADSRENYDGISVRRTSSNIYEEKSDKDEKLEGGNGVSGTSTSFARGASELKDFQNTHTNQSMSPHSRKEQTISKESSEMSFAQRVAQLKAVQRGLNHGKEEGLIPSGISFAERISQMRAFHRQHGHDNVPIDYEHSPGLLHWWLHTGKQFEENRGSFSEMELDSLYGLGIPLEKKGGAGGKSEWDDSHNGGVAASTAAGLHSPKIHINSWLTRFKELEHYESIHGDTRVPIKYPEDQHFADWVHEQRRDFSRRYTGDQDALSDERFVALQKLGFEAFKMNELSPSFDRRISQLKDFFGIFGHSKVPKTYGASGASAGLRDWLLSVRSNYKLWEEGDPTALSMKELEALNSLEFDWLGRKAKFAAKKKTESPSNVSLGGSPAKGTAISKSKSGRGSNKSVTSDNSSTATPSKKQAPPLTNGVSTSAKKYVPFADRLRRLEQFKATHGHTKVPADYEEDPGFSNWVLYQRKQFTKRVYGDKTALSDERYKALKRAGLKASKQRTKPTISFEKRLRQLQKYKAEHGDFDVDPNSNPFDEGFYVWVMNMRAKFEKKQRGEGKLSDERFEQLQNMGFR